MTITRAQQGGECPNGELSVEALPAVLEAVGNMSEYQATGLMEGIQSGVVTIADPTPGDGVNEYELALKSALEQRNGALMRRCDNALARRYNDALVPRCPEHRVARSLTVGSLNMPSDISR